MTKCQPISLRFSRAAFLMLPQLLIVKTGRNYHFKPVFEKSLKSSNSLFMDGSGSNYTHVRLIIHTLLLGCLNYHTKAFKHNYSPKSVSLAWSTSTIDQKCHAKYSKPFNSYIALLAINLLIFRRSFDFNMGKFDHQKGAFCDKISHKCLSLDVNSLRSWAELAWACPKSSRVVLIGVVIHGVLSEPVLWIGWPIWWLKHSPGYVSVSNRFGRGSLVVHISA